MSMRRRRFRLLSLGLAFALLAAQWALAGYACPKEQRAAAMAAMRAAGLPCDGADEQQPPPCYQQMAQAAQSAETSKSPLPSLPDLVLVRSVPVPAAEAGAGRAGPTPLAAAQRPPAGPVYLATRRLRD